MGDARRDIHNVTRRVRRVEAKRQFWVACMVWMRESWARMARSRSVNNLDIRGRSTP